ncbi:UAS protein [Geosmithia morbida]|uniref:UAS protein n=1 Tax=Geosmithia morbida TaxID=1094350 RepID=A0A9P4Z3X0_9HYPO|nr:UAS protein [Geosmithia morbida]KAF4126997.1 UAS protein [Geosmithia morbida]
MDENVSTFCGITGASADVAQGFMSMAGDDVSRAIELFFENPELASQIGGASQQQQQPQARQPDQNTRPRAGRRDSSGVIHIDSDDDDDDFMTHDGDDDDGGHAAATLAASLAQEEEDAAMAQRLQEELYGSGAGAGGGPGLGRLDEEGVRAPIARTTETLVAPDPSWGGADDDVNMDFLNQMRRRRMPQGKNADRKREDEVEADVIRGKPGRGGGPFSQRIWGDGENQPSDLPSEHGGSSHARRLADLFRPPYDIMERGLGWDDVRSLGKQDKKWIMVNLQDMNDFNCQALNRDIWKDEGVRSLVRDHFIFLQYDKDYPDAEEYTTFYFPSQSHENPDNYPHVSIVDPRTGEQVKVWSGRPFPSASDFRAELAEFLDRYSLEANSKNPVAAVGVRGPRTVDVDRMTEEEMLEMALKNSMAGAGAGAGASGAAGVGGGVSGSGSGSGSTSTTNLYDPDALTKASRPQDDKDKGKGRETEAEDAEDVEAGATSRAFAQISSTNPHTEPDNDPSTTTRIQFRHPTGRVIRRFNLSDPVRRAYEWLKASPLEGKDGVEFELKKMPQGQDLIDGLDATIEESGLKQGTVMIEFLE